MDTKFISINIAALIKYQATFYMFMSATLIFLAEGNIGNASYQDLDFTTTATCKLCVAQNADWQHIQPDSKSPFKLQCHLKCLI